MLLHSDRFATLLLVMPALIGGFGKDKNMTMVLVLLFERSEFRTLLAYFYLCQSKKCVSGQFSFCFVFLLYDRLYNEVRHLEK